MNKTNRAGTLWLSRLDAIVFKLYGSTWKCADMLSCELQLCLRRTALPATCWQRMARTMASPWARRPGRQQPATLSEGPRGQQELRADVRCWALVAADQCSCNPPCLSSQCKVRSSYSVEVCMYSVRLSNGAFRQILGFGSGLVFVVVSGSWSGLGLGTDLDCLAQNVAAQVAQLTVLLAM